MKILLLFLIFNLSGLFAAEKAQVVVLKGEVTKLEPGQVKATAVKKGDWLNEDTSLVTKDKSFVKLRFSDKTTMNVGPKSMVVINKMPEEKANMVNLLKGMIKADVKKDGAFKKTKTKMLVRTRSAVMGIRGTKFQTMYNHANKWTSLVTVEGKVAIVRNIKKDETELAKAGETISESQAEKVEELDQMFDENAKGVVEVSEGRYSGVAESIQKPTQPVKIAPKQYDAIAKSMDSGKRADEVMKMKEGEEVADGHIDEATGKITPKAGGLIDFATGLYIAPEADAKLNEETGTFEAKKVGNVNPETGDYIPPKGIKIDEKKGFIVDQTEIAKLVSADEKKEVLALAQNLNQGVVKKQVTTVKQLEQQIKEEPKQEPWGPKDHILSIQIRPYTSALRVTNKKTDSTAEFLSEKANWVIATWAHVWNETWTSRMRMGGHDYVLDDTDLKLYDYGNKDNGGGYFSIGFGYQSKPRLKVLVDFVNRDQFYVTPANGDGVQVNRRDIRSVDLGFEHDTLKWFALDTKISATFHLLTDGGAPGENGDPNDDTEIFGLTLEASGYYAWKNNLGLDVGLFYQRMDAKNSDFEFVHSNFGSMFNFVWDI